MPQRRSARLRAATRDSQAILPAPKRQRREPPLSNGEKRRSPLHEVTNAATISTRAHREIQANHESRGAIKDGKKKEQVRRRASKQQMRTMPTPKAHQATMTNPKRVKASETRSRRPRRQNLSMRKENEIEDLSVLPKEKDPGKSDAMPVAGSQHIQALGDEQRTNASMKTNNSEEILSSLRRKSPPLPDGSSKISVATRTQLKRPLRSPSPSPLYPEDEIQPKLIPTSNSIVGKQHRKRVPRPPSPVPLYPEDEIQPLPIRTGKEQSAKKAAKQPPLPHPPPTSPQPRRTIPDAPLTKPLTSHSSAPRSPPLKGAQVSGQTLQKQASTEEPSNKPSETPITPYAPQNLEPERGKERPPGPSSAPGPLRLSFSPDVPAPSRLPITSGPPAPLHTYSKRRHAVQDLALPTRKSLGVRSRASSGGSTGSGSKSEGVHGGSPSGRNAPLSEAESEAEDAEVSESDEESEKVNSALRSFIGQQRKMWDEIDNLDLEEDFD